MVEYSIGVCYGIIITDDERRALNENFPNGKALDDFSDTYLRQINSWCGGDWFLGLIYDSDAEVIPLRNIRFDKAALEELEEAICKYHILNWTPQTYIIQFCY